MKIENDLVEFTVSDFDGFSDPVKKTLSNYFGDYAAYFSRRFNTHVAESKNYAKDQAARDPFISAILESYAAADEAKKLSVASTLVDLDNALK